MNGCCGLSVLRSQQAIQMQCGCPFLACERRDNLLKLMAMLDQQIEPLDQAVRAEAQRDKMALLPQTQPG